MKLTLGFSPCPNDTFIFDALVNKKIDTGALEFQVLLEDVQTLNTMARNGQLDITKISYGVLPLVMQDYIVLNSGGALGKGVGPLLISKKPLTDQELENAVIAIPGENTTAHMLFSLAYPGTVNKKCMLFSDIEQAVLSGTVDAGVIIHENRFTYHQKGLTCLKDLGEFWEKKTNAPIPLGGIITRRGFSPSLQWQIDTLIRNSVEFAFQSYPHITGYVKQHAQEMEETVMRQHIDLYVNNYSIELGETGKTAVRTLLDVYSQVKGVEVPRAELFTGPVNHPSFLSALE
jgi:1,4-dihydroxy-6-naphthoate synthase